MPDEHTHADTLRLHLSGASSHNGAQTSPDASIGNYRSSTELEMLSAATSGMPANLTLAFVAGANGTGAGSLACPTADTIAWTPPSGTQGAAVTIANGETKVIEGGGGALSKYLRVSRTSAVALTGTATITLTDVVNNCVGFDDVTSAEATAGADEQRGFFLVHGGTVAATSLAVWVKSIGTARVSAGAQLAATGAGTVACSTGDFTDWDESGFCRIEKADLTIREVVSYGSRTNDTLAIAAAGRAQLGTSAGAGAADDVITCVPGIRVALEAPSAQPSGYITNSASESSIPSLTWKSGITAAGGATLSSLAATYQYGVRIRRAVVAGATARVTRLNCIEWSFDAP